VEAAGLAAVLECAVVAAGVLAGGLVCALVALANSIVSVKTPGANLFIALLLLSLPYSA
jgi:hypothetical protein